jgi:hypothetical protein
MVESGSAVRSIIGSCFRIENGTAVVDREWDCGCGSRMGLRLWRASQAALPRGVQYPLRRTSYAGRRADGQPKGPGSRYKSRRVRAVYVEPRIRCALAVGLSMPRDYSRTRRGFRSLCLINTAPSACCQVLLDEALAAPSKIRNAA